MSLIERQNPPSVVRKKASVRVKLERINRDVAESLPPDGDHQAWFDRLTAACGSSSPDFIHSTLFQLQAAARLPNSGLSETALNAALAMIENEQPRGETECAIVVQMATVHAASMVVLGRVGGGLVVIVTSWRRQPRQADCRAPSQSWSRRCVARGAVDRRSFALNALTFATVVKR
jgi:hypothetical protein